MRIAILGAGLSGLACAHELERLGLTPDIFDRSGRPDRPSRIAETLPQFLHHNPRQDVLEYLQGELQLPVSPFSPIRRMLIHGPTRQASLVGELGYVTLRGPDQQSLEQQLVRHVHTSIRYGDTPNVYELQHDYDAVVIATGNQHWTREFLQWQPDATWWVRGAHVTGAFAPGDLRLFFNTRYAQAGYAMIAPIDERTAWAAVAVPDSSAPEAEQCWRVFRAEQGRAWESESEAMPARAIECGSAKRHVLGNVTLVGNAGGFVEGLGMTGQGAALASGVYAARQIALGDRSLDRFVRRWRGHYNRLARIRQTVNGWTDEEFDRLVAAAGRASGGASWRDMPPAATLSDMLRKVARPSPGSYQP